MIYDISQYSPKCEDNVFTDSLLQVWEMKDPNSEQEKIKISLLQEDGKLYTELYSSEGSSKHSYRNFIPALANITLEEFGKYLSTCNVRIGKNYSVEFLETDIIGEYVCNEEKIFIVKTLDELFYKWTNSKTGQCTKGSNRV